MLRFSFGLFASLVLVGAIASGPGCMSTSASAGDAGAPIGSFGCCPDVKPDCANLATGGPKKSANDPCSRGSDGVILDPYQDGWTHAVDEYGCGTWTPPTNPKTLTCGVVRRPPKDADVDGSEAGDQDAGDQDAGDAGSD